ncbi:hypothetical protein D3C81_193480 [compost metagenome]
MQISNISEKASELTTLRIVHGDESLDWGVSILYRRNNFKDLPNLFTQINEFFAQLPSERQDAIWACYVEIYNVIKNVAEMTRMRARLIPLVKELYSHIDQEELTGFLRYTGKIVIPTTTKSEYDDKPQDKTYLREDYYQLAIMSVAHRPMVPIFGEFVEVIVSQVGNNFKEYYALALIGKSWLYDCPAMERLRVYIDSYASTEKISNGAVFKALGPTETPDWLLAKVIVRKVSIGEVTVEDNNSSVISNVYHTIDTSLRSMDRNFWKDGAIIPKTNKSEKSEEDNMSSAENYKIKQEVSNGDIVMLSVYTENFQAMARKVDPTVPLELVDGFVGIVTQMTGMRIEQHHMTLCQWVMSKSLSARAIPSLSKPALLRTMGVTQALLWHWGFKELSALMSAQPVIFDEEYAMGTGDYRARVSREHVAALMERCPYSQRQGGKQQSDRQNNVAIRAINLLVAEMSKSYWSLNLPRELLPEVQRFIVNGDMIVPAEIKNQLARLILERIPA